MKVEPVFLVEPSAPAASIPTRRAFLIAGGAFLTGTAIGGACGYSAGASRAEPAKPGDGELPKSGDRELDHLRWLAVKAPLDDLFAVGPTFLSARVRYYKDDVFLWRGVERLARETVANPQRTVAIGILGALIGQIEGTTRLETPDLRDLVPHLRDRLKRERAPK